MNDLKNIVSQFAIDSLSYDIKPLGCGLINDSYVVTTDDATKSDYVLQRINHAIFKDIDMLQNNISAVTSHIRHKFEQANVSDIDRKVLHFVDTKLGEKYFFDGDNYWRMMNFIPRSQTHQTVDPQFSYLAGVAFGEFQAMLADLPETLGETIPDFHNIELRLRQLSDAVAADAAGRVGEVRDLLEQIDLRAQEMCRGERLHREGLLPKRVCHCDTKVNNMLFDESGEVLCVIDLDTVMPSFIFSDYGDFLRTGANTGAEDDPQLDNVNFDMEIFKAFTRGYLQSASSFLTPIEVENLPYAAALFPYMQCVRFLADYINGDTYYKIKYDNHNLVRARAQFKLLQSVEQNMDQMQQYINSFM